MCRNGRRLLRVTTGHLNNSSYIHMVELSSTTWSYVLAGALAIVGSFFFAGPTAPLKYIFNRHTLTNSIRSNIYSFGFLFVSGE